jgi:hypothetical protein
MNLPLFSTEHPRVLYLTVLIFPLIVILINIFPIFFLGVDI